MNTEQVWALLREVSDTVEFGEEPVIDLPDTPEGLDELRARLAPISRAVRLLQQSALTHLQPHLGTRGFVKYGNRVYRAYPDRTQTVKREAEGELWDFISPHARQLFNPNYPRWGQLRIIAEGYVDPDTGEVGWPAFEARFFDVTVGDVSVKEIPADKAPKFIQAWEDGKVEKRG